MEKTRPSQRRNRGQGRSVKHSNRRLTPSPAFRLSQRKSLSQKLRPININSNVQKSVAFQKKSPYHTTRALQHNYYYLCKRTSETNIPKSILSKQSPRLTTQATNLLITHPTSHDAGCSQILFLVKKNFKHDEHVSRRTHQFLYICQKKAVSQQSPRLTAQAFH